MRQKLLFLIPALVLSSVGFIIATSQGSSQPHLKLGEFQKILAQNPQELGNTYLTLYGKVKEGSIERRGTQAYFILSEGKDELRVYYTGQNLLPDTFQDGSDAAVSGQYDPQRQIFVADHVLAKCASKYEGMGKNKP
ncbi:MAG: cytochrome c maturation protein CcmE [Leptospiraceae bacterium]|nr:cytochrome c maturation protein CcmE [Leptospiraceae bacterium]MDW8306508.1 cytochrome c maturation protein CcmE [Leptospiraceae bacterium]